MSWRAGAHFMVVAEDDSELPRRRSIIVAAASLLDSKRARRMPGACVIMKVVDEDCRSPRRGSYPRMKDRTHL